MRRIFYLYLFVFIFGVNNLLSQSNTSITGIDQFWVDAGYGFISNSEMEVEGYNFSFSYFHDTGLYSIRWISGKEYNLFFMPNSFSLFPEHNFHEYSLLYGRIFKDKIFYTSISTGLGYMKYDKYISFNKQKNIHLVVIPINFQLFLTPTPVFGIGIDLNMNLNKEKVYYSGFLSLQIGLLR